MKRKKPSQEEQLLTRLLRAITDNLSVERPGAFMLDVETQKVLLPILKEKTDDSHAAGKAAV